MGREEGSPIFAESIIYDSRRSRGLKKLLVGAVTIGMSILLTLAIAIPLSSDKDIVPPSPPAAKSTPPPSSEAKLFKLSAKSEAEDSDQHYYAYKGSENQNEPIDSEQDDNQSEKPLKSHWFPWRRRTRRPWYPFWPTKRPVTRATQTDHSLDWTTKQWTDGRNHTSSPSWPRTTKKDDKDQNSTNMPWNPDISSTWYPRNYTRRPWWTTKNPRNVTGNSSEASGHEFPPWHPWHPGHHRNHTRRPWWPTRHVTTTTTKPASISSSEGETTTREPRTTPFIPTPPSSRRPITRKCPEFSEIDISSRPELGHYANFLWYEIARIQSSEVELNVTSCSTVYVHVNTVNDHYVPEGAQVISNWRDLVGSPQSYSMNLTATVYDSQWLAEGEEHRIQLSFIARTGDYLLLYECLADEDLSEGYVIRLLSLNCDSKMNTTARSLLWLADSLGLNPEQAETKIINWRNC